MTNQDIAGSELRKDIQKVIEALLTKHMDRNKYKAFYYGDTTDEIMKLIHTHMAVAIQAFGQEVQQLIDEHDPQTGRTVSDKYWGKTLRTAIQKELI